jgi:two-component system, cell cycle sensor histidine kinase and response regulator CckA
MPTILVTDDDEITRFVVRVVLERHGYTVLSADPDEALEVAEFHAGDIDVLVTDIRMGSIDGFDLARRIRAHRPQVKVIYVSGHPYPECSLQKPYQPESLIAVIENALAHKGVVAQDGKPAWDPPREKN